MTEGKKTRLGIIFGGKSGEHEVSLLSAASVIGAVNKEKYELVYLGITKVSTEQRRRLETEAGLRVRSLLIRES